MTEYTWTINEHAATETYSAYPDGYLLAVSLVGEAWAWGVFATALGPAAGQRIAPDPDACVAATRDDAMRAAEAWYEEHVTRRAGTL